ncbi:20705_t:CDS:2, partial [Gigaspora rosea]
QEEQERRPNGLYTHKNINGWVEYTTSTVENVFQNNLYACGSPIFDEELPLYNTLFVYELISSIDDLSDLPTTLTDRYKK